MTPKEKAKELFNKIRYMDNQSGKNCSTCDCIVIPIAKFICDEIITACDAVYDSNMVHYKETGDGQFWLDVKAEIEKL